MIECDLLIVSVPFTDTTQPLQAPAILKAVAKKHNFTAETIDLNYSFRTSGHEDLEFLKQYYMSGYTDRSDKIQQAETYVETVTNDILKKYIPRYIAISVFTYQCQTFASLLAQNIKTKRSEIKIIFGGQGLTTNGIHANDSWPKECKELGLIDHYIIAEGEQALINLLKQGSGKGIDNADWEQKLDIDDLPYPDYENYDLNNYEQKTLLITGSRGCVRRCTFCDIHKHWKRFVFRSGQSIADEMISQSQKYNIYNFSFTDSLVNGSMKAYRDFVSILADYNQHAEKKLSWSGNLIVRGIKSMTEEDWTNTKKSGAKSLALGVESGSEKIRNEMKKHFSNKDLDEFMEQAHKNDVKCTFLLVIGYPTESHEDFLDTLRMFKKYKKYQKVIECVALGSTLGILPGTPVADELTDEIEINGGENFWLYKKNPTLDFRERIKRRMIIGEECEKMGYHIQGNENNLRLLHYLWGIYQSKEKQDIIDLNTSELHQQKYS